MFSKTNLHPLAIFCLASLCFSYVSTRTIIRPPLKSVVLDAPQGDSVVLSWETTPTEVTFELEVRALGYVALGISRSGGMPDSDIAVGWVTNDGKTILQDRFAVDRTEPRLDKQQDLKLISSSQTSTHTKLVFSRKLDTGDALDDVPIPTGDVHVIYAYTNVDPVDEAHIDYHDTKRGVKTIKLRS